jgi:MYXO-CTERM domain-containing protein
MHTVTLTLEYRVGASIRVTAPTTITISVERDSDGDGNPDSGDAGGCCQTGGDGPSGAGVLVAIVVLAFSRGRRSPA